MSGYTHRVRPLIRAAVLLFGSGLCALVYQVVWLREFRLVFGASTSASAAVLAVFLGGLGAGGSGSDGEPIAAGIPSHSTPGWNYSLPS